MNIKNKIKHWEGLQADARIAVEVEREFRIPLIDELSPSTETGIKHVFFDDNNIDAAIVRKNNLKFDLKLFSSYKNKFNQSELSCFEMIPKLNVQQYKAMKKAGKINNLDRALISTPAMPTLSVKHIEEDIK